MSLGSVQTIVTCVRFSPQTSQPPCPTGFALVTTQAYLIDPSQSSFFDGLAQPFDYAYASAIWSAAFTSVVAMYFISKSIGTVLEFIRRG